MTVIAGTDGSERAERAVTAGAKLAAAVGETLVVVCVHGEDSAGVSQGEISPIERAGGIANASARRVMAEFPGLEAYGRAYQGKRADGILRAAEAVDPSVIVVGNLRVQNSPRILGSIASELARKAPCDVYIAHTN